MSCQPTKRMIIDVYTDNIEGKLRVSANTEDEALKIVQKMGFSMKANEFLRDNGLTKCSRIVDDLTEQEVDSDFVKDLKRLVESWELVEKVGGLNKAKADLASTDYNSEQDFYETLKQAIADVESCNE